MKDFKEMNEYCKKGQIVFVGSTYFSQMKISERVLTSGMNVPVYDRSAEKLKISNALNFLSEEVFELQPSKIFVNIGDEDLKSAGFDIDAFISKYEWMLLNIHRSCENCLIYITSVVSTCSVAAKVNERLQELAKETGCTYINFEGAKKDIGSYSKVFNILKHYIRNSPIGFADAMQFVG